MRTVEVGGGLKPNTRLDAFLLATFPALSKDALYKAFRKRDVKVGGTRSAADTVLRAGDSVSVYLPDETLFGRGARDGGFSVVYEDARLLVVDKARGVPVHPDRNGRGITLIELAREYLNTVPATAITSPLPASPMLCHRLDRNTRGLVMISKDEQALGFILEKLGSGEIVKEYRCVVAGRPQAPEATLRAYLTKDSYRGKVSVTAARADAPPGAQKIVTRYKLLHYDRASDTSKLEVTLLTGRTHQIRAHLASIGHPIIGDGKYCPNAINRRYGAELPMLTAFRLTFAFRVPAPGAASGALDYLSNRVFEIPDGLSHPENF